jgi:hypothetical protein
MVRDAILEADNWDLQASRLRTPERSSTRRQIGDERRHDERSSERSITPYRRQFDISWGDEFRYTLYQYTRERRLRCDERSVTPYRPRRREASSETTDSSLSEGKCNLLQKFSRYIFFNQFIVNFSMKKYIYVEESMSWAGNSEMQMKN